MEGPNPRRHLADTQAKNVLNTSEIWHTNGTQHELDRDFLMARIRRVSGAKLFFPEETPELITEEALRLWHAHGWV
jgi:hypothetical protein